MRTMKFRTATAILLAVIVVAGLDAQPQRHTGPFHEGPRGNRDQSFRKSGMGPMAILDLTEDQQEQLKALRLDHFNTMKPLKSKMAELRARERTLLSREEVDMNEVESVIDEQGELFSEIRKTQVAHRTEMKKVLTDEQVMKLDHRRKMRKHRRHGRGLGPHRSSGRGFPDGPCCPPFHGGSS